MKAKLFLLAAVSALLAVSCTKEEQPKAQGEVNVSFVANVPDAIATKAFSDGKTATTLYYAVYAEDQTTPITDGTGNKTFELTTTVDLTLVTGKSYDIIFWAQNADAPYTFDPKTQKVTVDYSKVNANNENLDAFYYTVDSYKVTGPKSEDVKLTRPFAQVNVGTTDETIAAKSGVSVVNSSMTVKNVYTTLNLKDGKVSNPIEVTFASAAIPSGENDNIKIANVNYGYMAMNYILVDADKATTDLSFVLTTNEHEIPYSLTNVPVQRNYRTNIYGALLTNPTVWNVEIVPGYIDDNNHVSGNLITNATDLATAFAEGGIYTLAENLTLTESLKVKNDVVLDLNGKTINNTTDLWNATNRDWSLISVENGTLTLKNGTLSAKENDCYAVDVKGGKVIIESGKYVGNVSVVYVREGAAEIKGGDFSILQKNDGSCKDYALFLNCYDKAASASITVTGGVFHGFNPANNAAEGENTNFVSTGYRSVLTAAGTWTVIKNGGVYEVNDRTAFDWFVANIETFNNRETVKLGCDLDLADFTTSIKYSNTERLLNFDGNGHTIKNLTQPLFGQRDDKYNASYTCANISNLTIEDAKINATNGSFYGAIAANLYGNIVNCHIKNSTVYSTGIRVGGLVGIHNGGDMANCTATNVKVKGLHSVAALVGFCNETNNRRYSDCTVNTAEITNTYAGTYATGYKQHGSIVGCVSVNLTLHNCEATACTYKDAAGNDLEVVNPLHGLATGVVTID